MPTGRFIQENERICDCDGYVEPEPTPSPSPGTGTGGTGGGSSPSTGITLPYIPQTPEQIMAERMAGYNSVVGDILVDPFGTAIVAGPYVLEEKQLDKHAIVMIHGLRGGGYQFDLMANEIIRKNNDYKTINIEIDGSKTLNLRNIQGSHSDKLIFIINYVNDEDSPASQASGLNNLLMHEWFDTAKIDLIGHSMGGLVAYDYLTNTDYVQRHIGNLVAIGTPFDGSLYADLAIKAKDNGLTYFGNFDLTQPAYDYLSNSNGYLDELQSRNTTLNVSLSTISYFQSKNPILGYIGTDGVVSDDSATSLVNATYYRIAKGRHDGSGYSHENMTEDPNVINQVINIIFGTSRR
jgi:uncharacterized alpha/beta hydrolase family protein